MFKFSGQCVEPFSRKSDLVFWAGCEHGTNSFSQMTSNGLEEWVENAIEFSIKHGFDGLGKNIILI